MWADKIKAFTTWTLSIVAGTALAAGAAVVASGHLNSQATAPSTSAPSQSSPKPQTTSIVSTGSTSDVRYTDSEAPTTMPVSTSTSPRPAATPTTIVRERGDDGGSNNQGEHEYSGGDDN
jgi:cytoskeletal protein RodZ